ncbi:MAG: hypothetical protein A4E65_03684 [Syntrophorhabdus sp. PtaU1.Bin153]|nr:MAG: hypothetical protein A4E65_03684 [Syntrophorhabdus sp. PtaU1.Bin153]
MEKVRFAIMASYMKEFITVDDLIGGYNTPIYCREIHYGTYAGTV